VLFCFADFGGRSDVVDGYSVIESVSVALDHVRSPRACAALAFSATLDGAQASLAAEAGPATGGSRAAARLSAALGFAEDGELDAEQRVAVRRSGGARRRMGKARLVRTVRCSTGGAGLEG
jgi:hypothetical protein